MKSILFKTLEYMYLLKTECKYQPILEPSIKPEQKRTHSCSTKSIIVIYALFVSDFEVGLPYEGCIPERIGLNKQSRLGAVLKK